ncbi:unnamed protein product, partial [Mycena citricolor]
TICPDSPSNSSSNTPPAATTADTQQHISLLSGDVQPLPLYKIVVPAKLLGNASRAALVSQNEQLRGLLDEASAELERGYAHMVLMNTEHQRVRQQLYGKKKERRAYNTGA